MVRRSPSWRRACRSYCATAAAARRLAAACAHAIVELVDVYRTLAELAGVPVQPNVDGRSFARQLLRRQKEGRHLHDGKRGGYVSSAAAFSQYPRCRGPGVGGMVLCALGSSDAPDDSYVGWQLQPTMQPRGSWVATSAEEEEEERKELHTWIDVMGLSVRVQGWRYTEWYPWDKAKMAPAFDAKPSEVARELYAHPHSEGDGEGDGEDDGHDLDATENENLADTAEHASVQQALQRRLLDHFMALARAPPKRRETPRGHVVEVEEDVPHGRPVPSVHHPQEQQQRRRRRLALDWEGRRLRQERHRRLEQRRERGRLMRRAAAARGAMVPSGG